jgi:hypothetical protein
MKFNASLGSPHQGTAITLLEEDIAILDDGYDTITT